MEWQDHYVLGIAPMDATHREFVDFIRELSQVEDARATALLEDFIAHTRAHFDQENLWMEASAFPPIHCHTGEHQRVMAALENVLPLARSGNPGIARIVAKELSEWFEDHAATMDNALARHLQRVHYDVAAANVKQPSGSFPVVPCTTP